MSTPSIERNAAGRFRPSLRGLLITSQVGFGLLMAALLWLLLSRTRDSQLLVAEDRRGRVADEIAAEIDAVLDGGAGIIESFRQDLEFGLFDSEDFDAVERFLAVLLVDRPRFSELSWTSAPVPSADGSSPIVFRGGRQVTLFRTQGDPAVIEVERIEPEGDGFLRLLRRLDGGGPQWRDRWEVDPAAHATFQSPAQPEELGHPLWSDWAFSPRDREEEGRRRRVTLSVQAAVPSRHPERCGVLRVSLDRQAIDGVVENAARGAMVDEQLVTLCDESGRRLVPLRESDTIEVQGDDLRVVGREAIPGLEAALARRDAILEAQQRGSSTGAYEAEGETWRYTFRSLGRGNDWTVAVLAPERAYVGAIDALQRRLLIATSAVLASIFLGGAGVMFLVRRDLQKVHARMEALGRLEVEAQPTNATFVDTSNILEIAETAKTSVRAMSRYVPLGIVKRLYAERREPGLGGEPRELSIVFTDIADFTTIAEAMPVDRLALLLGRYLEVMTTSVHAAGGVVDKFIGDAVMALFNAPDALEEHATRACAAMLDCERRLEVLFDSAGWGDEPRFETRFGGHLDEVMVGHFGAPDRMNYTAIGDGVNLAARLEGLNKYYGTHMLVSEPLRRRSRVGVFRLIDVVAVKGRSAPMPIHELANEERGRAERSVFEAYERAFEHYRDRAFAAAAAILVDLPDDGPARTLLERCRRYIDEPPPADWNGVFTARSK